MTMNDSEKDAEIERLKDALSRTISWLDNCADRYDKLESDTDAEIERLKAEVKRLTIAEFVDIDIAYPPGF